MYTEHFGLKKLPFENVPDPVFFFDQGDYHRIRLRITESLKSGRGLIVVTGPIGSGKTTLSQMVKSDLSTDTRLIWIGEPPGNSTDLFLFIAQELGLAPSSTEKVFLLRDIKEALMKMISAGKKCLLIIDESHLMSDDTFNGIRLLNNLEESSSKLIQVLLLGQDEIMEIISRPEMEPFRQRIASLEILGRMNGERIREYVTHRIHVAGGSSSIITETGWEALVIAFSSGGIPRLVNSLCDRSFTVAFERNKTEVDVHDVFEATKRIGVGKEVFHYMVGLKSKERKEPVPPVSDTVSPQIPTTKTAQPTPVTAGEKVSDMRSRLSGVLQQTRDISGQRPERTGIFRSGGDDRKLNKPVIILFIAVIVLLAAFFLYCRSTSSDIITCLFELIGL